MIFCESDITNGRHRQFRKKVDVTFGRHRHFRKKVDVTIKTGGEIGSHMAMFSSIIFDR